MARNVAVSVENNFINGLVTEATGLNFPEAACYETDNCVFDDKGLVSRRLGFEYESGYSFGSATTRVGYAQSEFLWENAGGGDNTIVVRQVGPTLYFYKVSDTGSLSSGFITSKTLSGFLGSTTDAYARECQYTMCRGALIVVHPNLNPQLIKYTPSTNTIANPTTITVQVRDFETIDASLMHVATRPSDGSNTVAHLYNLANAGWIGYQQSFRNTMGYWPSRADTWWLFKNADEDFAPATQINRVNRGTSESPKGYYIYNAFAVDRSGMTGIGGLSGKNAGNERPSTVELFAGRVWYSGINAADYSTELYYSQIIEGDDHYGKCYQAGDPTSEDSFQLVASDGGVVRIPEAGRIVKLYSIEGAIIVFATNGIWSIAGSTGTGFSATDFTVKKISSIPALSGSSFVDVAGFPFWWGSEGIYTLTVNGTLGAVQIQSLVDKKIKSYFLEIPESSKVYARGAYNMIERKVQWVWRSTEPDTVAERYEYDRILNFNVITQAFYPWSVATNDVKIHGVIATKGVGVSTESSVVTNNLGTSVTNNALAEVTIEAETSSPLSSTFKYTISIGPTSSSSFSFADVRLDDYVDWKVVTITGTHYDSYFITGYKIRGDGQRKWQANYIWCYGDNSEGLSSFDVQCLWDYANAASTGRWSNKQRVAFTSSSYNFSHKRLKLRGHGKALQLKFSSVTGEPFYIVGYSMFDSANTGP